MSGVNKVIMVGRVGKDPETRFMTTGDAVCNFSLATSETWKDKSGEKQEKTEWHNCVAYRRLAEVIDEYVKKGQMLYLEGKLQTRSWEKDGVKRYTTEIIVNEMQMLGGKRDDTQAPERSAPARQAEPPAAKSSFDDFDDNVPF